MVAAEPPVNEYTVELIRGIAEHLARIDEVVTTYELLWCADDVPEGVAISEAVELATSLSTDESPKFVNGVLARVARERETAG